LVYKAGIKNMLDFAILWHAAQCGVTGCTLPQFKEALHPCNENTLRGSLARLEDLKLVFSDHNRDLPGHPLTWVISRIAYQLMTGHMEKKEKPVGLVPMVAIDQAG